MDTAILINDEPEGLCLLYNTLSAALEEWGEFWLVTSVLYSFSEKLGRWHCCYSNFVDESSRERTRQAGFSPSGTQHRYSLGKLDTGELIEAQASR